ncbi:hypothetical protein MTO96_028629 [Rhipicephalus appendiculatus]
MSGQNDQTPAEKEMESSLVSGEEEESYPSCAAHAWLTRSEDDGAYVTFADEGEMFEHVVTSGEACGLLSEDDDDMLNPPAVFNQDHRAAEPPDTWNMCLRLHCDSCAQPYTCSDFRIPLKKLGLAHEIVGIGPLTFGKCGTKRRLGHVCSLRRNERGDGTRAPPVEPTAVQVASTAASGSAEQSVSNQETAQAAEAPAGRPHEVVPNAETGNTSSGDQNASSEYVRIPPPTSCP